MNFDSLNKASCVAPSGSGGGNGGGGSGGGGGSIDPRCSDSNFASANPDICSSAPYLIISPQTSLISKLGSVQFTVYEYKDGVESQVIDSLTFTSSDPSIFVVGASSGSGTGIGVGSVVVTVERNGLTASATLVVLDQTVGCTETVVKTSILIDNSRSSSLPFGGTYLTRLDFAIEAALRYSGNIEKVNGVPKDFVKIWSFGEQVSMVSTDFIQDETELASECDNIQQSLSKTDLTVALDAATDDLLNVEASVKFLIVISDGEQTTDSTIQSAIDSAAKFKAAGGIIFCIGLRASGNGYDLLERISSGGFFINATSNTATDILLAVSLMKMRVCAGTCKTGGDRYVNMPELDYSSFQNFEVISGQVNLLGNGFMDFLPGNGLYVELAQDKNAATIRTIDSFALKQGNDYAVNFYLAGNNQLNTPSAGQQVMVYLRDVNASDTDPNLFEHVVSVGWRDDFKKFSFSFTAISTVSVKLYFKQITSPQFTGNWKGNLLDKISLVEQTTLKTLFSDDFDDENKTYVPPDCGDSPAIAELANPADASILHQFIPYGTSVPISADNNQYTYSVSYKTADGETAAASALTTKFAAPILTFEEPDKLKWTWISADPHRWLVYVKLSSGWTNPVDYFYSGSARQFIPEGSSSYYFIVGVDINGNEITERSNAVRPDDGEVTLVGGLTAIRLNLTTPDNSRITKVRIWRDSTNDSSGAHLLAELDPASPFYIDTESQTQFLARQTSEVAPVSNTTSVAAGALGSGSAGCYAESCDAVTIPKYPDPSPLPNIETGATPQLYSSTKSYCAQCGSNSVNSSTENLIPDMTSNTAPSGVVSSSGAVGGSDYFVFDSNLGNTFQPTDIGNPFWIQYKFDSSKLVSSYKYIPLVGQPGDCLVSWNLSGSDDGVSWTVLDTRLEQDTFNYGDGVPPFLIASPQSFDYYRINITKTSGTSLYGLKGRIEFYGAGVNKVCKTASATSYISQQDADAKALAAATVAATSELECVTQYTSTKQFTAKCSDICVGCLGQDITKSSTKTSFVSQDDADTLAFNDAKSQAQAALDCTGSNNTQQITINDFARATPYPSTQFVSGKTGVISKVTVAVNKIWHSFPDDIVMVLVSPTGKSCVLMANAGGSFSIGIGFGGFLKNGIDLVFDDSASDSLPDNAQIVAGTFKPTQYPTVAVMPSPCPEAPYGTDLSVFNGDDPNGAWSLWVYDDTQLNNGAIKNGFLVTITTV